MKYILGIETSCDDTSMAVIDEISGKIIEIVTINQNNIHEKYQGIVPALASLHHLYNITSVWDILNKKIPNLSENINSIAVTNGPGLTGSLLIGINFAYGLKKALDNDFKKINIFLTDHIEGHLLVNLCDKSMDFPFLGLIMSGGHTMVVYCESIGVYQVFSTTLDDAIGECLDKCGRFLNLKFPGGIYLEQLALLSNKLIKLPIPMAKSNNNNFSFSGLKTAVFYSKDYLPQDMANTIQTVTIKSVARVIKKAIKFYGCNNIVVGGGVINNKFFRQYLINKFSYCNWVFPGPGLSSDSGAIPASVVWVYTKYFQQHQLKNNIFCYNNLKDNKKFIWI
jgi:N6-L-threonylcarbamoyladenine synthase